MDAFGEVGRATMGMHVMETGKGEGGGGIILEGVGE